MITNHPKPKSNPFRGEHGSSRKFGPNSRAVFLPTYKWSDNGHSQMAIEWTVTIERRIPRGTDGERRWFGLNTTVSGDPTWLETRDARRIAAETLRHLRREWPVWVARHLKRNR